MAMVKISLRELKHTNLPSSLDSDQNTKESSAFTNSSFGHCAGTWQNNQCTAAPSEKSGQLFGVSLTDIFHKDNFPFPILVGLSLVFYCLPEERDLGEAKCPHANLPQMEKSLDSTWLWVRNLVVSFDLPTAESWGQYTERRFVHSTCFHRDPCRPVQISQNGLCVHESSSHSAVVFLNSQ